MTEKLVRNVALEGRKEDGFERDHWSGALLDEDDNIIWMCEHDDHYNDIEAEFCSLDKLLGYGDINLTPMTPLEEAAHRVLVGDDEDQEWYEDDEDDEEWY